jgi:hypothetical protein
MKSKIEINLRTQLQLKHSMDQITLNLTSSLQGNPEAFIANLLDEKPENKHLDIIS